MLNDQTNEAIAALESNGNYGAANPQSSARGKYQFMPATFEGVKKNNPDLPQISFEEFQKNPDAQEQYQQAFRAENQAVLDKYGIEKNPVNEYVMHWAGAPKGRALLAANDEAPLGDFFKKEVLEKNKLAPTTTVGDFKASIDRKMQSAIGVKSNTSPTPNEMYSVAPKQEITAQQKQQMDDWDALHNKLQKLQPGSPEYNTTVADSLQQGVKQEFGPNWTNAVIAALMGNKDQALTWITGGANQQPKIGEAIVNGERRQIWVNSNARGDTWFSDRSTGKRLPDDIQVTSVSPESAIGTEQAKRTSTVRPTAFGGEPLTLAEQQKHVSEQDVTTERARSLGKERGLIASINDNTRQFSKALDNISQNPQAASLLKTLNAFAKGGVVDENKVKEALVLANIDPSKVGEFAQYLKDIANVNKIDQTIGEKHAPGAGQHGEIDFSGGSRGVNTWLANRSASYAFQRAWNDFYTKNRNQGTVAEITRKFDQSDEYRAIENYKRYAEAKVNGNKINLKDGEKVADFDKNDNLIIKKYNAKSGKLERLD